MKVSKYVHQSLVCMYQCILWLYVLWAGQGFMVKTWSNCHSLCFYDILRWSILILMENILRGFPWFSFLIGLYPSSRLDFSVQSKITLDIIQSSTFLLICRYLQFVSFWNNLFSISIKRWVCLGLSFFSPTN